MRIISQYMNSSVEFNNIVLILDGKIIACSDKPRVEHEDLLLLGEYATEERAKEVFQDIHNAYSPQDVLFANGTCEENEPPKTVGGFISVKPIQDIQMFHSENYVYYMPKE